MGRVHQKLKPRRHTLESFTDDVRAGYSFCPVMDRNHRSQSNFISGQLLVLDFDNGGETCSLDTLQAHPFGGAMA